MRIIIIEDEQLAAKRLLELILKYDPEIEILGKFDTVEKSVEWFNSNPSPDLIFMDIQLADGLSFEIFEQSIIKSPIIFTTAYDQYAIKAFKVNSIDYLLKPIDFDELSTAIEKFKNIHFEKSTENITPKNLAFDQVLKLLTKEYKTRFVVKVGEHIKSIQVENISCFYSLEKATFLKTTANNNYVLDYSLDQIESLLSPNDFFRVNRKYIINLKEIRDIISYSNSRLKIILNLKNDEDIIVSREKVKSFKAWLEK